MAALLVLSRPKAVGANIRALTRTGFTWTRSIHGRSTKSQSSGPARDRLSSFVRRRFFRRRASASRPVGSSLRSSSRGKVGSFRAWGFLGLASMTIRAYPGMRLYGWRPSILREVSVGEFDWQGSGCQALGAQGLIMDLTDRFMLLGKCLSFRLGGHYFGRGTSMSSRWLALWVRLMVVCIGSTRSC